MELGWCICLATFCGRRQIFVLSGALWYPLSTTAIVARSKAASGRIKVAILTYFSEILQGMQSDPTSEDDMVPVLSLIPYLL